jgi:hypothetical protein
MNSSRALAFLAAALARIAIAQDAAPAAPATPAAISPHTIIRTAVGEATPAEKCWAMPDSMGGEILYAAAGGRWTPAASKGDSPSDPRWVDGAERIFVPGVTIDPLATPKSEDASQLWFDWRAPTLMRMVKGQGLVLLAGRTNVVMRDGPDLSLGKNTTVAEYVQATHSEDPLVREGAAWMLGWIPASSEELDAAEPALNALLQDKVDDVALAAVESLGRVGRAGEIALLQAAATVASPSRTATITAVAAFLKPATAALDERSGADARLSAIRSMGESGQQHLFLKRCRDLARTKDVYVAAVAVASSPNQRAAGPLGKSFFMKSGIVAEFRAAHGKETLPAAAVPATYKNDPAVPKWVALLFTGQPADLYQRALALKL